MPGNPDKVDKYSYKKILRIATLVVNVHYEHPIILFKNFEELSKNIEEQLINLNDLLKCALLNAASFQDPSVYEYIMDSVLYFSSIYIRNNCLFSVAGVFD